MNSVKLLLDYWLNRNLWSIVGLLLVFGLTQLNLIFYFLFYIALILFVMNSCVTYLGGHLFTVPQNSYIDLLPVSRRAYLGVFITMTIFTCVLSCGFCLFSIGMKQSSGTTYNLYQVLTIISSFFIVGLEGILLYFLDMEKRVNRELHYSIVFIISLTLLLGVFPIPAIFQNNLYLVGLLLNAGLIFIVLFQFINQRYFNKTPKEKINPILDLGSIHSEEKKYMPWYHRCIYGLMIVIIFFSGMAMDSYLVTGLLTFSGIFIVLGREMGEDRSMLSLIPLSSKKIVQPYLGVALEYILAGIIGCNILFMIQFFTKNSIVFFSQFNPIVTAMIVVVSGCLFFSFEVFLQQYQGTKQVLLRAVGIFIVTVMIPSMMKSLVGLPYQLVFSAMTLVAAYLILKTNYKRVWNI